MNYTSKQRLQCQVVCFKTEVITNKICDCQCSNIKNQEVSTFGRASNCKKTRGKIVTVENLLHSSISEKVFSNSTNKEDYCPYSRICSKCEEQIFWDGVYLTKKWTSLYDSSFETVMTVSPHKEPTATAYVKSYLEISKEKITFFSKRHLFKKNKSNCLHICLHQRIKF